MIRLAHISDSHFDERGRLDDVIAVHRAFLEQAAAASVDLILHAGDWFERRSTPVERNAVADFLRAASEVAPVFGVKGNHDQPGDLSIFNRLEVHQRVLVAERPTAAPGSAFEWDLGDVKVGLLALPWFDKAHLVSQVDAATDSEQTRQMTIAAARDLLTCFAAEATRLRRAGVVPIMASHVLVGGSEVSTGQVLIGTTVELAPADLHGIGAAYVALGHVHKAQEWHGGRVAYSGSPHRCNFGEPEPKGWRLVTLTDKGEFVSNEFRELPARRMHFYEVDMRGTDPTAQDPYEVALADGIEDALVRLRVRVHAEDLHYVEADKIEAFLLGEGAAEAKVEVIVEAETRARAPEIARAQTIEEKVLAFFRAKGIEPDAATQQRLAAKLSSIEAEVGHAAA